MDKLWAIFTIYCLLEIGAGFQIQACIHAILVTMIFIFQARIEKIENVFNLLERSPGKDSYDWRFKNLSGSQRQSHELNMTLKLTSGQVVETSVTINSPSEGFIQPDDRISSKLE